MSPVLLAAPAMSAREVVARSTVELTPRPPTAAFALMQPSVPHRLEIPCGERSAVLEPGLFSVVEVRHGTVARIRATPVMSHLPPADALSHARAVEEALRGVGFELTDREADPAALLAGADRARASAWTARFGSASWRAEVWIAVAARAGTSLAAMLQLREHGCLVSVDVWDTVIAEPSP